jgi:23S rRNA pseudouridine955/2504/2580 synthase
LAHKSFHSTVRFIEIDERQNGQRVDNFLLKTIKGLPRSRLYRIIRKGEVRVNKKRIKPDYKLQAGDLLRIPPLQLDPAADGRAPRIPAKLSEQLAAAILYEDDNLLVIDKPAGLAVHSGSGVAFGVIDVLRPLHPGCELELAHRLDRDTSGCLLLAKNRKALLEIQGQLQQNALRKNYLAAVHGFWDRSVSRVDEPLRRCNMPNGERRMRVDPQGQGADTRIEAVRHLRYQGRQLSLLNIRLLTGRTHQIRVHCQSQRHPIIGDDKYGDRELDKSLRQAGIRRLMLHAQSLEIPAGAHTKETTIEAPMPDTFHLLTKD